MSPFNILNSFSVRGENDINTTTSPANSWFRGDSRWNTTWACPAVSTGCDTICSVDLDATPIDFFPDMASITNSWSCCSIRERSRFSQAASLPLSGLLDVFLFQLPQLSCIAGELAAIVWTDLSSVHEMLAMNTRTGMFVTVSLFVLIELRAAREPPPSATPTPSVSAMPSRGCILSLLVIDASRADPLTNPSSWLRLNSLSSIIVLVSAAIGFSDINIHIILNFPTTLSSRSTRTPNSSPLLLLLSQADLISSNW